ncbi:C4-dicarboxylate ABC transporter permease [Sulfitobacter sp. F26204]|uniref:TRAP transporter small permease subunit n=1 Tax=Sulfitobacter sp. F26204 TaxID=2996014 RepID=UPI00225E3B0E|nr:TRAP transporter small permease subunit [Sulfitobacter sp. F26204]MCX7559972.1 C4-dicarboxylate ABC transporter permease [Sulfitobacter sp. F26204]
MIDALWWFISNLALAFYNFGYAITHPQLWLNWSDSQAIMRFVYFGASAELFFVLLVAVIIMTVIGMVRNEIMWGYVRFFEKIGNGIGRIVAWAGLLMIIQQIIIVFMQRIFTRPDIVLGFGVPMQFDISWYAEELKLYNALIICLCVSYAFIQGSHVRVDLLYGPAKFRTKKIIDMVGAVIFMVPFAVLTWMYGWFFLWRHLIVPNPSASDTLERLLTKARALRWNVETFGFSPSGFNGYFLFKILLCAFCIMILMQALVVFYRSYLELREGPQSEGKYLDKDTLGDGEEAYEGTH